MTERRAFDRDNLTDDRLRNDLLPGQVAPPLPPLQVVVEDTGAGVRVTVVNDGPLGRLNGAVRYDAYHADAPVDTTTADGKKAGFTRAVCVGSIPATDVAHTQSSSLFSDPKFSAGFWYVCGVGADGTRSEPSEPAQITRGVVDATIPGSVEHLQISESGIDIGGVVFSELSVTCYPPADTSHLGGVQLYLKDYAALNDVQEGYFHRWNGSGSINFAVPYPIPRRRVTSISLTATNASNSFTAASGLFVVARVGELLSLLGVDIEITGVTDTTITTLTNWPKDTVTSADFTVIGKPTIYVVSIGKSGARRDDIENAPSVAVLMDGNMSTPNQPANIYVSNSDGFVRIEWDQVAGRTIAGYKVYRSGGITLDTGMVVSPPVPQSGTKFLDRVPQNQAAVSGSNYARMQFNDSDFTLYDLEANSAFTWYVSTINTRGDESQANYSVGNSRRTVTGEVDPLQTGRNPGKNYVYNAMMAGTAGNIVLANDVSQDAFMGLTVQDRIGGADVNPLPGRPYGAASGQANGAGRLRGFTRWESSDNGTGAGSAVTFENGDEAHIGPPGVGKTWTLYEEVGAWDNAVSDVYKKMGKGEVFAFSFYVNHDGSTPDGSFEVSLDQYDGVTLKGLALRRFRDTNSNITTSSTKLAVTASEITATPTRYQAAFQLDSTLSPTKQVRINFLRSDGTTAKIVIRKVMVNPGEVAAQWTADMGDTNISIPVSSTPIEPEGDDRSERAGEGMRIRVP